MRKINFFFISLLISSLFFTTGTTIASKEDSLFIKIIGDTVQIWDINVFANCVSKFDSKIIFKGSDTIIVTQCDTVGPLANCMCNFDLHVSLSGLNAGQYNVLIYRQELKKYFYYKDTTLFIGKLAFVLENSSSKPTNSFFEQSSCNPTAELKAFTSDHWLTEAANNAKEIHEEAKIRKIYSDDISTDGKSTTWNYKFMWDDLQSNYHEYLYFHNEQTYVLFDSSSIIDDCCIMNISEEWFDSDSAISYAELEGGKSFREENPDYTIYASVYQALTPTSYPCWDVVYQSKADNSKMFSLYFDARKIFTGLELNKNLPREFQLEQNYPNPFNPTTKIKYSIPNVETHRDASVLLVIYDILGNKIVTLVNEKQTPGDYSVEFDAGKHGLSSGVYFYQLKAGNFIQTKKLILLK